MNRRELVSKLKAVTASIEQDKGPLTFNDLMNIASVFPGGLSGEEDDGQIVIYTGYRETRSHQLKELP